MDKLIQKKAKKFILSGMIKKPYRIYRFQNLNIMHLGGAFFLP